MAIHRTFSSLNGDLEIVDGNLVFEEGIESVRQRVCQRLAFILGEWFLNLRAGMPYLSEVFTALRSNTDIAANIIAANIADVQGVSGVVVVHHSLNASREFDIRIRVNTELGEFDVDASRTL